MLALDGDPKCHPGGLQPISKLDARQSSYPYQRLTNTSSSDTVSSSITMNQPNSGYILHSFSPIFGLRLKVQYVSEAEEPILGANFSGSYLRHETYFKPI